MRVALIIENFNQQAGGNERSTAQIAEGLTQRGHEVTIITASCRNRQELPGIRILAQRKTKHASFTRLLAFAVWARKQLRENHFDATWSVTPVVTTDLFQPHGGTVRETLARNIFTCPTTRARLVKRLGIALTPKKQALLFCEKRLARKPEVQKFIAISSYVQEQFVRHYQIPLERIERIPIGAVMPRVDRDEAREVRRHLCLALNIPESATLYLFAAQNARLKGINTLMAALRQVVDQGQQPMLLMAGSRAYQAHAMVNQLELAPYVRVLGFTEQMATLYAGADVTVLPTFYDPCSLVVIESLMAGTPAISTAYNGASDFIAPEGSPLRGRVIADPADATALAKAMIQLADPQTREQCRLATEGLHDQLNIERHIDQIQALLIQCANHRQASETPVPAQAVSVREPS